MYLCLLIKVEVATGRFPYSLQRNKFQQIQEVVEGPAPTLPPGMFSEQFEDFTRLWSVNYRLQLILSLLRRLCLRGVCLSVCLFVCLSVSNFT